MGKPEDAKPGRDGKVEVRVTMFPDDPIRVPPDEVEVLRGQGLLIEDDEPGTAKAPVGGRPAAGRVDQGQQAGTEGS